MTKLDLYHIIKKTYQSKYHWKQHKILYKIVYFHLLFICYLIFGNF